MLPEHIKEEILEEAARYERKSAVCIDALKIVQEHRGWISDESIAEIGEVLDMTPAEVDSVATFYNLIHRRPVGRHVIRVCSSVSCWVMGVDGVLDRLQKLLGIKAGETTADGRFTIVLNQCLGTCDHAPALMIDEELHRDVDPAGLEALLETYK